MQVCLCLAASFFATCAGAQSVPPGWKTLQVRYTNQIPDAWEKAAKAAGPPGSCEIAVPPDWKSSPLANGGVAATVPSSSFSHPFEAEVQADVPGPTFPQQVQIIKNNDKSLHIAGKTVLEDSPKRYWTAQNPVSGSTEWDVTVPGHPNCEVIVRFPKAGSNEATARSIVMSLRPVK